MLRGIPLAAARLGGLRGSVVDYVRDRIHGCLRGSQAGYIDLVLYLFN